MEIKTAFAFVADKGVDAEAGTVTAFASTESRDRDGDVIEARGIDYQAFKKNPVILASHQHRTANGRPTVLGSAVWIRRQGNGLKFKLKWSEKSPLAREYRDLFEEGHMRAFSIGFIPREVKTEDRDKIKDLPPHVHTPRRFTRSELLEISPVAVPSNRDALIAAVGRGVAAAELALLEEKQGPSGFVVQTVILAKSRFESEEEAREWADGHDFRTDKVDETEQSWRFRQRDPDDFSRLRTIRLDEGVTAVGGPLKRDYDDGQCKGGMCKVDGTHIKGARLAALLNDAIDEMVDDETPRAEVIARMARAAGIEPSTVNQILEGTINCPPLIRLAGFARVLDVSAASMRSAAEEDGCTYDGEEEAADAATELMVSVGNLVASMRTAAEEIRALAAELRDEIEDRDAVAAGVVGVSTDEDRLAKVFALTDETIDKLLARAGENGDG